MRNSKNRGVVYTGRVGARLRPSMRGLLSTKRCPMAMMHFVGGPLCGCRARLADNGDRCTLPIICKGQAGRYVHGLWQSA